MAQKNKKKGHHVTIATASDEDDIDESQYVEPIIDINNNHDHNGNGHNVDYYKECIKIGNGLKSLYKSGAIKDPLYMDDEEDEPRFRDRNKKKKKKKKQHHNVGNNNNGIGQHLNGSYDAHTSENTGDFTGTFRC